MMIKKCKKISSLFFLLIFAFPLQAQDISLVVEGIGDSKANAIIDAQRNALRASYGEFVSSNLTTLNNQLTKNENVNLVSGTIKDFKVISESENDFAIPPIVEVLMSVTVNKGKLVSFAKAIGDNVEIQGSLFGAEIRQQEINKNNEAIAMDHLARKAETMSAFFDYKISVESPKRSPSNEEDYYIYSSLSLKTNNNYANLMNTVIDTLFQVAMDSEEREKYDELGTPYYALYLWAFERYSTRRESERADRAYSGGACNRASGSMNFLRLAADCVKGEMQIVYLRSKESFFAFHSIREQIERSVVGYEVSRKTRSDSKLLFPFPFVTASNEDLRGNPFSQLTYHVGDDPQSHRIGQTKAGGIDSDNIRLIDRVLERQPEKDKKRLSNECPDRYQIGKGVPVHLCYEEVIWTDYVRDVLRMYGFDGYKNTMHIATFEPGGFFSDANLIPLALSDNTIQSTCSSRMFHESKYYRDNPGIIKENCTDPSYAYSNMGSLKSLTYPVFAYSKKDGCSNCTFEGLKRFGVLLIFPNDFEFSVLKFEDLVSKELLPTITAYTVDPDKPTKR